MYRGCGTGYGGSLGGLIMGGARSAEETAAYKDFMKGRAAAKYRAQRADPAWVRAQRAKMSAKVMQRRIFGKTSLDDLLPAEAQAYQLMPEGAARNILEAEYFQHQRLNARPRLPVWAANEYGQQFKMYARKPKKEARYPRNDQQLAASRARRAELEGNAKFLVLDRDGNPVLTAKGRPKTVTEGSMAFEELAVNGRIGDRIYNPYEEYQQAQQLGRNASAQAFSPGGF